MPELNFFDRKAEYSVIERHLPHWAQAGVVCFLTYRTEDSMPAAVIQRWIDERDALLKQHGIKPGADWKAALHRLPPKVSEALRWKFTERFDDFLDECHGACVLKRPELSKIVADNLRHLDNQDYWLTDLVVMPNHVHALAAFRSEPVMLPRIEAWKRYQARQINAALKDTGRFWQVDGFDHLVRSAEQFDHYRRYIADNPGRANLQDGEFVHYSKPLEV